MKLRSKLDLIARWTGINTLFFLSAFTAVAIVSLLAPQTMLSVLGRLDAVLRTFGSRTAAEFGSQPEMFAHILRQNSIAVLIFLVLGFLLQAPLALPLAGGFYALISFLAPFTIGHAFGINDWLLIGVESMALLLTASLGSAFAGELYRVNATFGDWWRYSKKSWRSISMQVPNDWRMYWSSWRTAVTFGVVITLAMMLFVAWFEVYGY